MSMRYNQSSGDSETHFSDAVRGELNYSKFECSSTHITAFDAGRLVPIYCGEVLPDDTWEMDFDSVVRQITAQTPTMGNMFLDVYAFFVPNRVVNDSFKTVMGENVSGSWTAPAVALAPLYNTPLSGSIPSTIQIPVGSVADYYGFPTQAPMSVSILRQCNDLKFRGYVEIWNEYFRDQNYQPPIPMSKLNVYQGFFSPRSANLSVTSIGVGASETGAADIPDNAFGFNSVSQALYGSSSQNGVSTTITVPTAPLSSRFNALAAPLKVNKLHDYFTSCLPSPQKAADIFIPVSGTVGSVPVVTTSGVNTPGIYNGPVLFRKLADGNTAPDTVLNIYQGALRSSSNTDVSAGDSIYPANLATYGDTPVTGLAVSVNDLRMSAAMQQYAECLALGGSRYREFVRSFFGLEVDDPFSDIPQYLGHVRRDLDLYQTAQTSASESGSTPQGHLSAFGYTSTDGHLIKQRFVEHGYVHVFAVVRHRNIYSSYLAPDNFRVSALDFYSPQLANISEQPVYTKYINPFVSGADTSVFGYQEAWAEYRYDPDIVTGAMRPGIGSDSLALWNYADDYIANLKICDATFLQSNSDTVLSRTLAVTTGPQFYGAFKFRILKGRAMPIYSLPGMDIV